MNSLSLSYLSEDQYPLWNAFVENSPQGSFFNTTTWAGIISRATGRPCRILACIRDDRIIGGMMWLAHRKFGVDLVTPVPMFPYNGPIFYRPGDEKTQKTIANRIEIVGKLTGFLNQYWKIWIIDTHWSVDDLRSFQWQGCRVEVKHNYLLSLKDPDLLRGDFSQSVRRKIKRAGETGVTVRTSANIDEMIRLYTRSYGRHHLRPVMAPEQLQDILKTAVELPQVTLYYAYRNGTALAGRLIVRSMGHVHDLLAGSDDSDGTASTYLLDHIITQESNHGERFDFMGADHPEIARFKRGFAPDIVHSFRILGPLKFPLNWIYNRRTSRWQRIRTQ